MPSCNLAAGVAPIQLAGVGFDPFGPPIIDVANLQVLGWQDSSVENNPLMPAVPQD